MARKQTLEPFTDEYAANVASVKEFANRIKQQLKGSTTAWRNIAKILEDAEAQHGFASEHMKQLISEVRFSSSKANKLIQISKSKRLEEHAEKFVTITSWTVLYNLTSLNKKDFQTVLDATKNGSVVSVAWINDVLGRSKRQRKEYRSLFTVEVNLTALKSQEFDREDFTWIEESLNTLKSQISFIEISGTGIFEKEQERFERDWVRAREKALKKLLDRAIEGAKNRCEAWKRYRNPKARKMFGLSRPTIEIYDDAQNVYDHASDDHQEVFDALDADWFSEESLLSETHNELEKLRAKSIARSKKTCS